MCGSGKHGVLLAMAPSILSNFSHTFYVYMFHGIEYFTLFFLFQVNHMCRFFFYEGVEIKMNSFQSRYLAFTHAAHH